jgi:SAP domain
MADTKKADPFAEYQDRPLTAEEKQWLHEWSRDDLIEVNERLFAQREAHDNGEPIDVKAALDEAGIEPPPAPPQPTYVGAQGGVQQGPLIVDGEDNAGRVPLPRDHPLTDPGVYEHGPVVTAGATEAGHGEPVEEWDGRKVRAEVNSLSVEDLKANLRDFDEPVSGNKDELRDRLVKALKHDHDARAKGE